MAVDSSTIRRWTAIAIASVLVAGALGACGDSNDDGGATATSGGAASTAGGGSAGTTGAETTAGATTRLAIAATESGDRLGFSRRELAARPGDVTIALTNPADGQLPHAVEIEGGGVEKESATIQPGGDTAVTAPLRPGRYTFYCPVGNHRELGMEGTLTVR